MDEREPAPDRRQEVAALHEQCRQALAEPGDWLTGAQRVAIWAEVRDARTNELDRARRTALTPAAVDGRHGATDALPAAMVEVAHRVASDPGRLTRAWADEVMAEVGEERYTEAVGVVAIAEVLDRFEEITGNEPPPLPAPVDGGPAGQRPDGVGDVGAWVSQAVIKLTANVSRALSLVPVTNRTWRRLVDAHYSHGREFLDLHWDRSLSRPQVELVAGRTTALLECFY